MQKITRVGAEVQNFITGEAGNISPRSDDGNISEQLVSTAGKILGRLDRSYTRHTSKKVAKGVSRTAEQGMEAIKRSSSCLQFTDEERATLELQKTTHKSDEAANKLDIAQKNIPKKKKLVRERAFDKTAGTGKTRLHLKETEKLLVNKMWYIPLPRPVREVGRKLHGRICEVEKENAGVGDGYAAERLGEKTVGKGYRPAKNGIRHYKLKLYRAAAKAEQSAIKVNVDFLYQKALRDNPQFVVSNPLPRFLQKQHTKRSCARQIRDTGKTVKNAGGAIKSAVIKTKEAAEKTVKSTARNRRVVLVLLVLGLFVILLLGALQSCSSIFRGASSPIITTSYLSEDSGMLAAEVAYSAMKAELQHELDNFESLHPGYDEYRYDLDEIGHDPYVLISILSAFHEGVFTIDEIQGDLEMLFEKQYILTLTEEVEVCYRTEADTWTDDEGSIHTDTYEVPYNHYILSVKLENFNPPHTPVHIMGEETLGLYAMYMPTLGNRLDLFPTRTYPNTSTLKEPTYYDILAEVPVDETFAALITEVGKYLGFPYVWGGSNPRTSFDRPGFVSRALANSGVCNTGRLGAQGLYNISTPASSADAKPGDLIFSVGTHDTPGVSHVGIYVGGRMMLHCGNPISYANINTSYWQSHFYAFARPPYN